MLFRARPYDAELVAWTQSCATQECDPTPTSVRFHDGVWGTPVDLSWGPGSPVEQRHVYGFDPYTPVVAREAVAENVTSNVVSGPSASAGIGPASTYTLSASVARASTLWPNARSPLLTRSR